MRRPIVPRWIAPSLLAAVVCAGGADAQQIFVYPQRGQSPEEQQRDRFECHQWAVQQTGFDPTTAQMAQAPPPSQGAMGGPSAVRGAAGGAAIGAVGGAIAGNPGKGAAIGAAAGGLVGGMKKADQNTKNQQQQQNQAAQQAQASSAYTRALGACLQGRGYTVQ